MDKGWFAIERGRWANVASKLLKTKTSHIGLGVGIGLGLGIGIGVGIGPGLGIGLCLAIGSAGSRNAEKLAFSVNQTSLC